ncbi:AAA family ATPase [Thermococcus sp. JCM 11816]|uniref:AAA family ATPase n=1 Tax=Thermococcus sp. (strain JCM 11816 / KS-1) TaxID=1295125 RepID=UPI00373FDAE7
MYPPFRSKPTKKKILEALEEYKNSHPEKWEETLQEDQFFGYKEVGHGKIDKFIKFLLVPAVKSVSEETEYKKGGSIITELTQLIIEEHIRSIPEFNRLEKRYKHLLKSLEAHRKTGKDKLFSELSNELTQILEKFAPNTQANISWG